ncbi:hypothetical protein SEA_PEPE25_90 [Microbacterium phage Pepe25]|nr:hypothetical protein SEA_PEPE25_90 [Microbacterium phage Pepe25]
MAERTTGRRELTNESLTSGLSEQYAVLRSYGMVKIELRRDGVGRMPFLVSCEITKGDAVSITDRAFEHLNDARRAFRSLVKKHP